MDNVKDKPPTTLLHRAKVLTASTSNKNPVEDQGLNYLENIFKEIIMEDIKEKSTIALLHRAKVLIADANSKNPVEDQGLTYLEDILKEIGKREEMLQMECIIDTCQESQVAPDRLFTAIDMLQDFLTTLDPVRDLHKLTEALLKGCNEPSHDNFYKAWQAFQDHLNNL